jgi:hypothetical protein
VLVLAHAGDAILGFKVMFVAQVEEGRKGRIHFKQDVTAATAVTAVRSAKGDKLFAEEGKTAATAITSLDVYVDLIDEFHMNRLRVRVRGERFRGRVLTILPEAFSII